MLTLSRRVGEKIHIGGGIEIEVVRIDQGRVRLGITAPLQTKIVRQELMDPASVPVEAASPYPCPGCWGRGCLDCVWTGEIST